MGYLFGIVLCFTILAYMNYMYKTRGEREARRREKREEAHQAAIAAAEFERHRIESGKTCNKGWHSFGMWKDSAGGYYQYRYCTRCGVKDQRIA